MLIWGLLGNVDFDIDKDGIDKLERRAEQASSGNVQLKLIWLDYLELDMEPGKELVIRYKGEQLELPDVYWLMVGNTDGRYVEKILEAEGVAPLAPLAEIDAARSKVLTYARLAKANIPFPKTRAFFHRTNMTKIIEELGYPFVIKPNGGHGGFGVTLIHDEAEWLAYKEQLVEGETYLAQEYISTSRGRDLRVELVNGKIVGALTRTNDNPDEFRSNIDQGGVKQRIEPDELVKEMALKTAALFDVPLLSVDFMFTETGYTIAEVNAFPGTLSAEQQKAAIPGVMQYFMAHQAR